MKYLIFMGMMLGFSLVITAGESLDVSGNASLNGGNHEASVLGGKIVYSTLHIESKFVSDFEKSDGIEYQKHLGFFKYQQQTGNNRTRFISVLMDHDSKKGIDFRTIELLGLGYLIIGNVFYDVGLGHQRENRKDELIMSHKIKYNVRNDHFKNTMTMEVYHGINDFRAVAEIEIGLLTSSYLPGLVAGYEYNSDVKEGIQRDDYFLKAQITIPFGGSNDD